jgi:hypothetical protein
MNLPVVEIRACFKHWALQHLRCTPAPGSPNLGTQKGAFVYLDF